MSDDAKNLIGRLICDRSERFGQRGLVDFKSHSFLGGIDWDNIRDMTPPYVPDIQEAFGKPLRTETEIP